MVSILDFKIGMEASIVRSFISEEVKDFAKITGDHNPIHIDELYAKDTIFKSRIVHGAFASSMFSTLFANNLPGAGSIYLKSNQVFLKPIFLDEPIVFKVKVIDIIKEKKRLIFETTAISKDQICITGTAEIFIP